MTFCFFSKANEDNCKIVMETLEDFCDISGQSINLQKSVMFVSPNIHRSKANALHFTTHIPITKDLGKYLGVPLIHGRLNKGSCAFIVEKVQKRLAGWKARLLNLAGRVTLIKHVTSSLPVYSMQTVELPISVCDKLDSLNRNFLWGDTVDRKKVHLINWDTVCKSKDMGGLGIRNTRDANLAMLSKLGWKLSKNDKGLWAQVLRKKYMRHVSPRPENFKRISRNSHIWRGVVKTSKILKSGTKWRLGNGKDVSF